jgi:hypothetical protein
MERPPTMVDRYGPKWFCSDITVVGEPALDKWSFLPPKPMYRRAASHKKGPTMGSIMFYVFRQAPPPPPVAFTLNKAPWGGGGLGKILMGGNVGTVQWKSFLVQAPCVLVRLLLYRTFEARCVICGCFFPLKFLVSMCCSLCLYTVPCVHVQFHVLMCGFLCVCAVWFCYVVYNSPYLNGFNICTFLSIIVVITLGKCAHRTPSGFQESHTCNGLIKS